MSASLRRAIWALAAAISVGGCVSPHQSVVVDVDPVRWKQAAMLLLQCTDTLTLCDMELFVRHNGRFRGDTLSVEITTLSPDTLRHTERFLLHLPRTAPPAALIQQTVIPYRRQVRFRQDGIYRITITPTRPVAGVEALGINLVKSI